MSRLESEYQSRYMPANDTESVELKIKPESDVAAGIALPVEMRREVLEAFDTDVEFQFKKASFIENTPKPEISPEIFEALSNAQRLFAAGDLQVAKNLYRSVLRLEPNNTIAIQGIAKCCRELRQDEEAIRVLTSLVSKSQTSENYLLLAEHLYSLNYNEDSLRAYLLAISSPIENAQVLFEAYKNIGNLHMRLGDADGAEEYYNKAYTLNPDSDVLRVNFGSLAIFRGDSEKALTRYREAVKINDKNDKAWTGLAMIHREYGDSELAWANVEKALDINPANESAIKLVCDWATKDNEIDKGIMRLVNFLKINDQDAFISMMLAKFYFYAGHLQSAVIEMEKALTLDPALDDAAELLAVMKQELHSRGYKTR